MMESMAYIKSDKRDRLYPTGKDHHKWMDEPRVKTCQYCGKEYGPKPTGFGSFRKSKFCSRECGWKGQKYLKGQEHPNWKEDSLPKRRDFRHDKWAREVISRDMATCQECHITGIEMHAHHINDYKNNEALRWNIDNGVTLCHKCHWDLHSALDAKAVNSGEPLTGGAEGNPEPSHGRKVLEGVTTSGRAYRRWEGNCEWCGKFLSKRWSDVKNNKHVFCSHKCHGKWFATTSSHGSNFHQERRPGNG